MFTFAGCKRCRTHLQQPVTEEDSESEAQKKEAASRGSVVPLEYNEPASWVLCSQASNYLADARPNAVASASARFENNKYFEVSWDKGCE